MHTLRLGVAETTYQSELRKTTSSIITCRWSRYTCPTNLVVLRERSLTACRTTCPEYPKTDIWLVEASPWRYNWNLIYLHPQQYTLCKGLRISKPMAPLFSDRNTNIAQVAILQATNSNVFCIFFFVCFFLLLLQKNFTHISYSLSLLTDPQVIGNIIRDPLIKIDYTCVYPYIRRVSLPFPVVPFSR